MNWISLSSSTLYVDRVCKGFSFLQIIIDEWFILQNVICLFCVYVGFYVKQVCYRLDKIRMCLFHCENFTPKKKIEILVDPELVGLSIELQLWDPVDRPRTIGNSWGSTGGYPCSTLNYALVTGAWCLLNLRQPKFFQICSTNNKPKLGSEYWQFFLILGWFQNRQLSRAPRIYKVFRLLTQICWCCDL